LFRRDLQINLTENFFLTVRYHAAQAKSRSSFSFRFIKLKKLCINVVFYKNQYAGTIYLYKGHVDLVNVRSLLPVHLDVHEVFVHHLRHLLTIKKNYL
jgi:hypothetical protein